MAGFKNLFSSSLYAPTATLGMFGANKAPAAPATGGYKNAAFMAPNAQARLRDPLQLFRLLHSVDEIRCPRSDGNSQPHATNHPSPSPAHAFDVLSSSYTYTRRVTHTFNLAFYLPAVGFLWSVRCYQLAVGCIDVNECVGRVAVPRGVRHELLPEGRAGGRHLLLHHPRRPHPRGRRQGRGVTPHQTGALGVVRL